jgi:hypothetical protein
MSKQEQNIEKEISIIEMPSDAGVIKNLQEKLKEYKQRLTEQEKETKDEAGNLFDGEDTKCKIAICERLLLNGNVNIQELADELSFNNGAFTTGVFENAVGVIEDYTKTGGKNNRLSTGFGDNIISTEEIAEREDKQSANDQVEIEKIRAKLNGDESNSLKLDIQQVENSNLETRGRDADEQASLVAAVINSTELPKVLRSLGEFEEDGINYSAPQLHTLIKGVADDTLDINVIPNKFGLRKKVASLFAEFAEVELDYAKQSLKIINRKIFHNNEEKAEISRLTEYINHKQDRVRRLKQ